MDLSKIKLIVSEIDGIVTEDMSPIDELGFVPFKLYYMKDFEVINEIKKYFIFVILSSDNKINYHLCGRKKIPFYWAENKNRNKRVLLQEILCRYSVAADETLYLGCSLSDLECIKMIPCSFCPQDGLFSLKQYAEVIPLYGGTGVLSHLYEHTLYPEIQRRSRLL